MPQRNVQNVIKTAKININPDKIAQKTTANESKDNTMRHPWHR